MCMEERLQGNPVSEGIAYAKSYIYIPGTLTKAPEFFPKGQEEEKYREFREACEKADGELVTLYNGMCKEDSDKAKIFSAHRELLQDEEILDEIREAICAESMNPEQEMSKLSSFSEDVILVAHDLLPSDTATMDRKHVKGILTEVGGVNSHSAILARSYGIPAILGVPNVTEKIPTDTMLAMDGLTGEIFVTPGEECIRDIMEKQVSFFRKKEAEKKFLNKPAIMKDGTEIKIGINIGSQEFDVPTDRYDFIGLFRTEFLYMEGKELPGEETQFEAYRKVIQEAKGHPVTLRTLDIGGDKTLPYMELPKEDNPFLGKRAIRLCFAEKELFLTQLRAALRASAYGPLQIMFPMVGSLEDIRKAKEYLNLAKEQLKERKQQFDEQIRVGIMIEIPAIALIADLAAEEVDFASIGSNDLTQYLSAADRMNPEVAAYYRSDSTAMLRLLRFVFQEFSKRGKEISVCGEMAGNPETAQLLVGLGARKLSMSSGNIAGVKAKLAECTLQELTALAEKKL